MNNKNYRIFFAILSILPIVKPFTEIKCPTEICKCMRINNTENSAAECSDMITEVPHNIISLKIIKNDLNLTSQTLYSSQNVLFLDISGCNLSEIKKDTFSIMKNLQVLNLSNNKLTSLAFEQNLHSLTELYLDHNDLTSINDELLNLTQLRILSVSHNKLISFPSNLPRSLRFINMSFNDIAHTIQNPQFDGEILDLKRNQIECIASQGWNMINLKVLRLGDKVKTILIDATDETIGLTEFLSSARNWIERPKMDGATQNILKKMLKLTFLTLDYYLIEDLKFLQPMEELNKLILSYIKVDKIDSLEGFDKLQKLNHLDLEGSKELTSLILDNIKSLPIDESLTYLGLRNTELKQLHLQQMPGSFFIYGTLHPDIKLDLQDNILQCDINICWIFLQMKESHLIKPKFTFCTDVENKKSNKIRPLLENGLRSRCLETQFRTTYHKATTEQNIKYKQPFNKNKTTTTDIIVLVIITFLIVLLILIVCLTILYLYLRFKKMHMFLPTSNLIQATRLQEIDHSTEDIHQGQV
uniref:LRRCT domain-containing protein n=1 Tax=Clastoptera arizonana TaxID=38151 RepID=A0A1B6D2I3_9HEMI